MDYILASKSPRRNELMKKISSSFTIQTVDINEENYFQDTPINSVKNISFNKGVTIARKHPESVVISADTIVVLNNKIYGKPKNETDAIKILKELSNKTHQVITAFSIFFKEKSITDIVISEVTFNALSEDLINRYVMSKSPLDKAGAYGIQDNEKYPIIKSISGSRENIIGFPTKEIINTINRLISK